MVCSRLGANLKERLLSTKRVSARHQVNGRIAYFEQSDLFRKPVRQKKCTFLRSVRVPRVRNFGGFRFRGFPGFRILAARLKSGPDVFADALV